MSLPDTQALVESPKEDEEDYREFWGVDCTGIPWTDIYAMAEWAGNRAIAIAASIGDSLTFTEMLKVAVAKSGGIAWMQDLLSESPNSMTNLIRDVIKGEQSLIAARETALKAPSSGVAIQINTGVPSRLPEGTEPARQVDIFPEPIEGEKI